MKNIFKLTEVYIVDYCDFDKLVEDYYNKPGYSVVATLGCGNDTKHLFNIKKERMDDYDYKHLFETPQRILTDLCFSGMIPEGNYLIEVSW